MEFIFKWAIMIFFEWFKIKCLRRSPGEFLSISKLLKKREFDFCWVGVLLKHLNSLQKPSWHQNILILDTHFQLGWWYYNYWDAIQQRAIHLCFSELRVYYHAKWPIFLQLLSTCQHTFLEWYLHFCYLTVMLDFIDI